MKRRRMVVAVLRAVQVSIAREQGVEQSLSRANSRPACSAESGLASRSGGKVVWLTLMPMPAMALLVDQLHQNAGYLSCRRA